ncbi:MAG: hypothetical protein IKH96_09605 [Ruminococcus sp.]|uniref:hypothetical protein n=1 Tax=Ruminococcus sp. TaxID=41978 RepID=UPI0025DEFB23|nr:hypothetical protein [Ruminococcus sp.]MBR6996255.1 hypothetical protein [Ruminococcus sp.]
MATITLYASRVNLMPGLFGSLKGSVNSYTGSLDLLRRGALGIDSSICDLEDVISALRSSSDTQEALEEFWGDLQEAAEDFIDEVAEIDEEVSELIATAEEDFYSLYDYLRPEDGSWLDSIGDFFSDLLSDSWDFLAGLCQSATEWIRAHRDEIAEVLHKLVDLGEELIGHVKDFLDDHPWIGEFFSFLGDAAGFVYDNLISPLIDLASYIYDNTPLHYLGDFLYDKFKDLATLIISGVGRLINTDEFGWVVDKVITLLSPVIEIGKIWTAEKLPGGDFVVGLIGAIDPDGDGVYHIKQDTWQGWGPIGYNPGYDNVFRYGVEADGNSIDVYKTYDFTFDGQEFVFWAWKGDYMNLGAGSETGIYINSGDDFHYLTGTDYALDMSMTLSYDANNDGIFSEDEVLFDYNPFTDNSQNGGKPWANDGRQWWVNGFDTNTQNVQAEQLQSVTTVRFDSLENGDEMYEALKTSVGEDGNTSTTNNGHWEFDDENHTATLTW